MPGDWKKRSKFRDEGWTDAVVLTGVFDAVCRVPEKRAEQQRIVRLLVERVIVSPSDIEVRLHVNGIEELALELRPAVPEEVAA